MESVGPTIEMIEVAAEWRCRGIGTFLFDEMQMFMLHPFSTFSSVSISACQVSVAAKFFSKMGFRDADGMMEEMMKTMHYNPSDGSWESDDDDWFESERGFASLSRIEIERLLPRYNERNGTHIIGRPVSGRHRKPCTECDHDFDEYSDEYYYTDAVSPWGADKFCQDCMAALLGSG